MPEVRAAPADLFVEQAGDPLAAWGDPQPALDWDGQNRPAIRWGGEPAHLVGVAAALPEGLTAHEDLPDLPPSEDEDWPVEDQDLWEAGRPLNRWSSVESCCEE